MPTTIAVSRKRSFMISADKTFAIPVVARTMRACADFFPVIATTAWLPWPRFGATLGPVGGCSKDYQALFLH